MSKEMNQMVLNMGILTSSKSNLLREGYDKIVNSSLDLREVHKQLKKKKYDEEIIWGLIGYIGLCELTQREYDIVVECLSIGDEHFDERAKRSLLMHIEEVLNSYMDGKDKTNFEEDIKRFEVNNITIMDGYNRYNICYIDNDLMCINRRDDYKVKIEGIILYPGSIKIIEKDAEDKVLLENKSLFKIV